MPGCVVYHFAYSPRRSGKAPAALTQQAMYVRRFTKARGLEVIERFQARLTNRDRHFADTGEFRDAIHRAGGLGCPLVLGDVEDMLARTPPELIGDCARVLLDAGIAILDARTGHDIGDGQFRTIVTFALREAVRRRHAVKLGLKISKSERQPGGANQRKAARGAVLAANKRAEKLRPTVEEIRLSLPAGTLLTATVLARELNARSVLTDSGKSWSRNAADRLLDRLATQWNGSPRPV